jgi:hypothetical protein
MVRYTETADEISTKPLNLEVYNHISLELSTP